MAIRLQVAFNEQHEFILKNEWYLKAMVHFSFLIVNYNTEEYIIDLIKNIAPPKSPLSCEIIIVNNVQNDKMANLLTQNTLPIKPTLIQSPQNIGFGRAMNMAASAAKGKHLLITNPDIVIDDANFIDQLNEAITQNPDYGAMTCRLLNNNGEDKSEFDSFEFGRTLGLKNNTRWLSGAFLFMRAEVYRQLNGFDEDFFMYCEDEDLCLRVQKLGLKLVKLNALTVYHSGGASEPIKSYDYFCRWFRSQWLFAHKHFEQDEFHQLLHEMNQKSRKKYAIYRAARWLKIPRYLTKLNQWQAMKDVSQKTLSQGTNWLYFKPNPIRLPEEKTQ